MESRGAIFWIPSFDCAQSIFKGILKRIPRSNVEGPFRFLLDYIPSVDRLN